MISPLFKNLKTLFPPLGFDFFKSNDYYGKAVDQPSHYLPPWWFSNVKAIKNLIKKFR